MAPDRHCDPGTEWLEAAPRRFGARDGRVVLGALVLAVVVSIISVVAYQQRAQTAPGPAPTARSGASIPPPRPSPSPTPSPVLPSPRSSIIQADADAPFLGITDDYEILGYGPSGIVRIQPSRGRVIETTAPPFNASNELSIVAGRDFVVVRPTDGSVGYGVRDGTTAYRLSGVLGRASFVFPAPDADHLWVTTRRDDRVVGMNQITVSLVDRRGHDAGLALPVPYQGSDYAMMTDGTGYLITLGTGGYYLSRPEGLSKITSGSLLAVGPTRFLTYDCDSQGRCRLHVVDRATDRRRELAGQPPANLWTAGRISPDGRYASLVTVASDGGQRMILLDLITGARRQVPDSSVLVQSQGMAWTPDSRFLLVAGDDQMLRAIDPRTGAARELNASIPPLIVIAIRPTG